MASHQLAIAKASFAAGLLRPDPTSVTRDEIAHFHSLLEKVLIKCSATNIQNCKKWLLMYSVQSAARVAALGKYLTALSISFAGSSDGGKVIKSRPSARRRRLHVLYLINDLLHHLKYHQAPMTLFVSTSTKIQPFLLDLVSLAASFKNSPKQQAKLTALLDIWLNKQYYSLEYINKLREAISYSQEVLSAESPRKSSGDGSTNAKTDSELIRNKEAPFIMPASHGDISTPYYDLPAGNMMPHILPNSANPINPQSLKPIQFMAGPADTGLIAAVKSLLDEVEDIFSSRDAKESFSIADVDELGQIIRHRDMGEYAEEESYYGWSKSFCKKMKIRGSGAYYSNEARDREESRGRSSSPRKRRRYSLSESSRSRSYSRGRSSTTRSSRSRSPRLLNAGQRHNDNGSSANVDEQRPRRSGSIPPPGSHSRSQASRSFSPMEISSQTVSTQIRPVETAHPQMPMVPHLHGPGQFYGGQPSTAATMNAGPFPPAHASGFVPPPNYPSLGTSWPPPPPPPPPPGGEMPMNPVGFHVPLPPNTTPHYYGGPPPPALSSNQPSDVMLQGLGNGAYQNSRYDHDTASSIQQNYGQGNFNQGRNWDAGRGTRGWQR